MKIIFSGQVPKHAEYPDSNEDYVEISHDLTRLAISDGASESYDSKSWSKILVEAYLSSQEVNAGCIEGACKRYREMFDLASLGWAKKAAFERGSFGTLLCVAENKTRSEIKILCIGDSHTILLDGDNFSNSYPYKESPQFKQPPVLLSTIESHNQFLQEPNFYALHQENWSFAKLVEPRILCMTDALAEWAMRMNEANEPKWRELLTITDNIALERLVRAEQESKRMRTDDVTLVSLEPQIENRNELSNTRAV